VLAGLLASTLAPFQRVLHTVARTILDLKLREHVTLALQELHWLPVAERIQYKLCLLVHKLPLRHMLDYISDLLTSVANIPSRSTLCASSYGNLVVPWTHRRIGDRGAFSVTAPRAWKKMPTALKLLRSTDSFHCDMKNFYLILSTAPGYGLTLSCALGLLVRGAIQVPQLQLQLQCGASCQLLTVSIRAFSATAPQICSSLSDSNVSAVSMSFFQQLLNTILFQQSFSDILCSN